MLRVTDCIRDGIGIAIPQPTEWQHIGNQINAVPSLSQRNHETTYANPYARNMLKNMTEKMINRAYLAQVRVFRKSVGCCFASKITPWTVLAQTKKNVRATQGKKRLAIL
jgi:hypothetical protein